MDTLSNSEILVRLVDCNWLALNLKNKILYSTSSISLGSLITDEHLLWKSHVTLKD